MIPIAAPIRPPCLYLARKTSRFHQGLVKPRLVALFTTAPPSLRHQDKPSAIPSRPGYTTSKKTLLYERDPTNNKLPRLALFVSTFNTAYWAWYSLDFLPAINSSPVADLHVDPLLGYIGLAFAGVLNVFIGLYPKRLISRVALVENEAEEHGSTKSASPPVALLVTVHDLPLINPTPFGPKFNVGEIKIDPASAEAKQLATKDGDPATSMARFRGHLPLWVVDRRAPYLLNIQDDAEVVDPESLLHVLIDPEGFLKQYDRKKAQQRQRSKKRRSGSRPRRR
jgi:hypothetical protein